MSVYDLNELPLRDTDRLTLVRRHYYQVRAGLADFRGGRFRDANPVYRSP